MNTNDMRNRCIVTTLLLLHPSCYFLLAWLALH